MLSNLATIALGTMFHVVMMARKIYCLHINVYRRFGWFSNASCLLYDEFLFSMLDLNHVLIVLAS